MRTALKHFVVWLTVAAVWFGASGVAVVPLHVDSPRAASDDVEWYPCKDHGCGCVSAEMCRTACCCIKPPPPPEPEKPKSCCDEEAEDGEQQASSVAVEWRVIIKSAECSGHRTMMSLKSVSPVPDCRVKPDCLRLHPAASVEHDILDEVLFHSLPVDPPPPRLD